MSGGVNGSVQASAGAGPALKRVLRRAAAASPFFTGRRSGGASAAGGLAACACGEEANVVDLTTGEVLLTLPGDTELVTATRGYKTSFTSHGVQAVAPATLDEPAALI